MEAKEKKFYVFFEEGLLYESLTPLPYDLALLGGTKAEVEIFEFNTVRVNGVWYEAVKYEDGMAELKKCETLAEMEAREKAAGLKKGPIDELIELDEEVREEQKHIASITDAHMEAVWDDVHKKLWDSFEGIIDPAAIDRMVDIGTANILGITLEVFRERFGA